MFHKPASGLNQKCSTVHGASESSILPARCDDNLLADDDSEISCKMNGMAINLKGCFVKRAGGPPDEIFRLDEMTIRSPLAAFCTKAIYTILSM
jgi:hypothetical protein